jgi:hypothetical protein
MHGFAVHVGEPQAIVLPTRPFNEDDAVNEKAPFVRRHEVRYSGVAD